MAVPLTVAQTTASQMSTSGSAGLAGGVLPVAARQLPSSTFFAKTAARIPENRDITDQTLELSSFSCSLTFLSSFDAIRGLLYCSVFQPMTSRWSRPHASGWGGSAEAPSSAAASRSGCRVLTSQYGAGSSGSDTGTRTAALR